MRGSCRRGTRDSCWIGRSSRGARRNWRRRPSLPGADARERQSQRGGNKRADQNRFTSSIQYVLPFLNPFREILCHLQVETSAPAIVTCPSRRSPHSVHAAV